MARRRRKSTPRTSTQRDQVDTTKHEVEADGDVTAYPKQEDVQDTVEEVEADPVVEEVSELVVEEKPVEAKPEPVKVEKPKVKYGKCPVCGWEETKDILVGKTCKCRNCSRVVKFEIKYR